MEDYELFNMILSASYNHGGMGCDWTVERVGATIYVLFQGSTTKEDWKHNFQFLPKPIKPYKNMSRTWYAHSGFVEMYKAVRDDINDLIKLILEEGGCHNIVVAGHSQGGAIAQLCAEDLVFRGYYVILRTFGSPKVFYGIESLFYIDDLNLHGICYENGSDIVPFVPPFAFSLFDGTHIGEKFNVFKIGKCAEYHMGYGNKELYKKR